MTHVSACSDPGPRDRNEDGFYAAPGLLVLADGMGGHLGGQAASAAAVGAIQEELSGGDADAARVASAIDWASQCVRDVSAGGTTLVVAVISGDTARVAWVGDSRAYWLSAEGVALLTEDHHDGSGLTRWLPDAADPEQVTLILQPGEQLVLCTDGITDVLSDTEIADIVAGAEEPADALVAEALDAGANDNCTAVVYTHGGAP